MSTIWILLIGAGAAIIAVLAIVAGRLLWRLRQQNRARQQRLGETAQRALEGIRVLAGSYLAGQVEACEVALRITVLLDQPGIPAPLRGHGQVFAELAGELGHIPTHQAWRDLPAPRRSQLRSEMDQLEIRYRERLLVAARALTA